MKLLITHIQRIPDAFLCALDLFDLCFQVLALGHGLTEEIEYLKRQERLTFARAGITDPLSLEDYIAHDGYRGLQRALTMTPEAIVAEVTESGLRGRGLSGRLHLRAGFHIFLSSV